MELLSCPFCGGKGEITMEKHASSKSYFISCEDCDAQGKGFDKTYVNPAVLAIAAWNKRVVVPLSNTSDQQPR